MSDLLESAELFAVDQPPKSMLSAVNPVYLQDKDSQFFVARPATVPPKAPSVQHISRELAFNINAPLDAFDPEIALAFNVPLSFDEQMKGLVPFADCEQWFRRQSTVGLGDCQTQTSKVGSGVVGSTDQDYEGVDRVGTEAQYSFEDDVDTLVQNMSGCKVNAKSSIYEAGANPTMPVSFQVRQGCAYNRVQNLRNTTMWSMQVEKMYNSNDNVLAPQDHYLERRAVAKQRCDVLRKQMGRKDPIDLDNVPLY